MIRRAFLSALAVLPFVSLAKSSPKDIDDFIKDADAHMLKVRNNSLYDIHEDRVQLCRLLYNYMYDNRNTVGLTRLKNNLPPPFDFVYISKMPQFGITETLGTVTSEGVMSGQLDDFEFTGELHAYIDAELPILKHKAL